jgi:hypothetical protein
MYGSCEMEALAPIFSAISAISGGVGAVSKIGEMFGGGGKQQKAQPVTAAMAPAPAAQSPALPGTSPEDFTKQQQAYWQNMLASSGQGVAGGALPEGIESMIEKQASLIK